MRLDIAISNLRGPALLAALTLVLAALPQGSPLGLEAADAQVLGGGGGGPPRVGPVSPPSPRTDARDRSGRGGGARGGPGGSGGYSPGGQGTPGGFVPGGAGEPAKGDGPTSGQPGGGGGPGPGGVGTPGGQGGSGTGGGAGGGPGGGPGGGAGPGGPGGAGPPLPPPLGGATGPRPKRTREGGGDDSWVYWWRLNELYELELDRRYRERSVNAEPDRDMFIGGVSRGRARPIEGATDRLRRKVVPTLRLGASHRDARVRAESVLALGKVGDEGTVSLIAPFAKDTDLQVRKAALLALGMTGSERAYPHLRHVLRDPTSQDVERAFAALGLGILGDRRATPDLIRSIERGNQSDEVRASALYALGHLRSARARVFLEYWVLRAVNDDRLRGAAAQGLAAVGDPEVLPTLERLLEDPSVHVRRSAALGLGGLDFESPYRRELALKERDFALGIEAGPLDSPLAREQVENFLGRLRLKVEEDERRLTLRREEAVRALIRHTLDDSDVMVRNFGLVSLGRLGGAEARAALRRTFGEASLDSMRAFAALGLGLDGSIDDEALQDLRRTLARRGVDQSTRGAVALALGLAEEGAAGEVLGRQLRTLKQTESLEAVALALGLVDHESSASALGALLRSKSRPEVKRELGAALGLLVEDEAIEDLGKRLAGNAPVAARVAAAEALSLFPDERSLDRVLAVLENPGDKDRVLAACARAVGLLCERGDRPISSRVFRDLNYLMRFQALNEAAVM